MDGLGRNLSATLGFLGWTNLQAKTANFYYRDTVYWTTAEYYIELPLA